MVLANQTLGGEDLDRVIRERVGAGPCEFWVVVPATPVQHLEPALLATPVMGGMPSVQGTPEEAQRAAVAKLEAALARLRALGVTADGAVGDPDPLRAATDALAGREVDEIIVATLPSRLSRWLRQDLPTRLEHKLHLPVTHVASRETATGEPDLRSTDTLRRGTAPDAAPPAPPAPSARQPAQQPPRTPPRDVP
jgi:GABA permease